MWLRRLNFEWEIKKKTKKKTYKSQHTKEIQNNLQALTQAKKRGL